MLDAKSTDARPNCCRKYGCLGSECLTSAISIQAIKVLRSYDSQLDKHSRIISGLYRPHRSNLVTGQLTKVPKDYIDDDQTKIRSHVVSPMAEAKPQTHLKRFLLKDLDDRIISYSRALSFFSLSSLLLFLTTSLSTVFDTSCDAVRRRALSHKCPRG